MSGLLVTTITDVTIATLANQAFSNEIEVMLDFYCNIYSTNILMADLKMKVQFKRLMFWAIGNRNYAEHQFEVIM